MDSTSPLEKVYEEVLSRIGNDADHQHVVRVLFQDIRDYAAKEGREPRALKEEEVLRLALSGLYSNLPGELDMYRSVLRRAEQDAGLPGILATLVKEKMEQCK